MGGMEREFDPHTPMQIVGAEDKKNQKVKLFLAKEDLRIH